MLFKYYEQPATFSRTLLSNGTTHCGEIYDARCATTLYPTGGINLGGTLVTIFGAGFSAFTGNADLASCMWGDPEAARAISTPTALSDDAIVCPTPPRTTEKDDPLGDEVEVRVSLNGVHFVDTNHSFTYYEQPANFSSITPKGGPKEGGTMLTLTGDAFSERSFA